MKKLLLIIILIAAICVFVLGKNPDILKLCKEPTAKFQKLLAVLPVDPAESSAVKPSFSAGETFSYAYKMGPLKAGKAKLTFHGEDEVNGRKALWITFESKVGTFYDLEAIYADPATYHPIYIERKISNFGFTTNIKEEYDQENYNLKITKTGLFKENVEHIKKASPIHNSILLIYYCRSLPEDKLKKGLSFDVVLPLTEFKVELTHTEGIEVPAGLFKAYVFESKPEKIRLWIAMDKRRTPLKMENLTSFGPSSIILEE